MKVLIAPLNWGIGHATRSIPIILHHLEQGNTVFLASSGDAFLLLRNRFPQLHLFTLPDYNIFYSKSLPVWLSVSFQSLKIYSAIRKENSIIQRLQEDFQFDLILSDNRYGVYHPDVESHFICHQLNPKSPFTIFQSTVERLHRKLCRPFNKILIPDYKNRRLTGDLCQQNLKWDNIIEYIGPLSQLNLKDDRIKGTNILVLLSGKEPQRSILETMVFQQLKSFSNNLTIVSGKLSKIEENSMQFYNINYKVFLNKIDLEAEINKASIIICRSGYSTIMDLHNLSKKTIILIPTPGQTEQEYLAKYISLNFSQFIYQDQNQLNLQSLIKNITNNG